MFDFSVYAAPCVVLVTMLVALVGFAVWGRRAIKESAEVVMREAAREQKAAKRHAAKANMMPPTVGGAEQDPNIDVLTVNPAANLERTAEFNQAGFAETFKPEEPVKKLDFEAAIARITADLAAAEAEGEKSANVEGDIQPAEGEPAIGIDEDLEATGMLSDLDRKAILQEVDEERRDEAADDANDVSEATSDDSEADNIADDGADNADNADSIEQTLIMPKLGDEAVAAATAAALGADMLDKIALEETRTIQQEIKQGIAPGEIEGEREPGFGEGAEVGEHKDSLFPEAPVAFGPKMAWLAIPGYKPSEVISALRLGEVAPANWTKGLSEAYADNKQVFVTPSLSGWVLVIGKTLWQKADMNRSAENIQWLKDVGRLFGNACFFSTMRGLGNHGWVGIRGGDIVRAYGYSGELQELIWLFGDPTEEEIAINPGFANEIEERNLPDFRPVIPDEKMVLAMSAAWSVDVSFRNKQYLPDYGFIGTLE